MSLTRSQTLLSGLLCGASIIVSPLVQAGNYDEFDRVNIAAQIGPRPGFLVDQLAEGDLKDALQRCRKLTYRKKDFSIGHRGAAMQFPEHTLESYVAAARQGAGIVECDVTFTKDGELVCRHSQCDLHTTTDIVTHPELNAKCTVPWEPDVDPVCCTSDITLDEFKSLKGKMDASNPSATTPEEYLGGTANWRTDLYAGPTSGTLMTHAESVELFKTLGVKVTPELKAPSVSMPFDTDGDSTPDFSYDDYRQKLIDELKAGGIHPREAFVQSFVYDDILYWIANEPKFGEQAVYLDDANDPTELPDYLNLAAYKADGVNIVAPPMWALVTTNDDDEIVPSQYAINAKAADLKLITWTLERSGYVGDGNGDWYYQTVNGPALQSEGDILTLLDVLAQDVGVEGIFSDWPATVTFYANCMKMR